MTFLELVQALWRESGASGATPGPTAVTGQTGEYARLVNWVIMAWTDIQAMHTDWGWARTSASFTTVNGQAEYPLGTGAGTCGVSVATFGEWARDTGRSYLTSAGTNSEMFLTYMDYDAWRDTYQFGGYRSNITRPIEFAISPAKAICLGPAPLAGYTITLDYFTAPTTLAADGDIPAMPAQYHMAIAYRALMFYGAYESAPEVYQRGELEFGKIIRRLEATRMPELRFSGALA